MKNVGTVKLAAPEYICLTPLAPKNEAGGGGGSHTHNTEKTSHCSQSFRELPQLYTKHITQMIPLLKISEAGTGDSVRTRRVCKA